MRQNAVPVTRARTHTEGCGDVNSGVEDAAGVAIRFPPNVPSPHLQVGEKKMTAVRKDAVHRCIRRKAARALKPTRGDRIKIAAHSSQS